jgi:hypothetical protein
MFLRCTGVKNAWCDSPEDQGVNTSKSGDYHIHSYTQLSQVLFALLSMN